MSRFKKLRRKPKIQLPQMTDLEFFWGPKNKLHLDKYWHRAFKPQPGKPFQQYFHIYIRYPINAAKDFKNVLKECVPGTFRIISIGPHGKRALLCCPEKHWNSASKSCIKNRARGGSGFLIYKVMIPESDLPRLLRQKEARPAIKHIRGLSVEKSYFGLEPRGRPAAGGGRKQRNPDKEIFKWGRFQWNITKAKEIINKRKKNIKPKTISVNQIYETIRWNIPLGINIDEKYALTKADITKPLIFGLVKIEKQWYALLIDGHHRLYRAKHEKVKTMPAYFLTEKENKMALTGLYRI